MEGLGRTGTHPAGTRTWLWSVQIYGIATLLGAMTRPGHFQLLGPKWGRQQEAACAVLHFPPTDVWPVSCHVAPIVGNRSTLPRFPVLTQAWLSGRLPAAVALGGAGAGPPAGVTAGRGRGRTRAAANRPSQTYGKPWGAFSLGLRFPALKQVSRVVQLSRRWPLCRVRDPETVSQEPGFQVCLGTPGRLGWLARCPVVGARSLRKTRKEGLGAAWTPPGVRRRNHATN